MFDILLNHNTLVLFGIIFFGIALGSIKIYGLNLGLSGVLFVALAAGHYRLAIPNGVGQLGLALFVYCVGLSAGNRFFSAIAKQGSKLAVMSVVIVGVSALFTCLFGIWFEVPAGISSGIFAGACTSTPALAAATESLPGASGSGVSIGYGIAYPFGVVGVVLFVQLLPRLLHFDLNKEAKAMHSKQEASIISRLVRVTQPNLIGQNIADCKLLDGLHCMVTRVVRNDRLMPLTPEDTFREGTEVLIVGNSDTMPHDVAFLGEVCDNPYPMDSQKERRKLILTNKNYAGRKLRELKTLRTDGVIISRISRLGFTFVPTGDTTLERNDVLTVVGSPENLTKYGDKIGHRSQDMNQTDLLSLGFGLSLGIILGLVNFSLGNGLGISLGIAGGPLIVALLLGHFGRLGPIVGYIPRPTRLLLQDLGLVFFLADAGIKGGADLVTTGSHARRSGLHHGRHRHVLRHVRRVLRGHEGLQDEHPGMPGRHLRRHDLHPGPGRHRQQDGLPGSRSQLRHRLPRGPHPDDHHRQGHHPNHRRRGGDLTRTETIWPKKQSSLL